jgi:hypothetical protein
VGLFPNSKTYAIILGIMMLSASFVLAGNALPAAAQSEDSAQPPANASEVPTSVAEELTGKTGHITWRQTE